MQGASNIGKPDKPRYYKHIIGNKKKPFFWSQYKKGAKKKKEKKRKKKQQTKKTKKNKKKKQKKKDWKSWKRVDGDYFILFDPMIGCSQENPSKK